MFNRKPQNEGHFQTFDQFKVLTQPSGEILAAKAAQTLSRSTYASGFKVGETEVTFQHDHICQHAGFFVLAMVSELGVQMWNSATPESMVDIAESYFITRYVDEPGMLGPEVKPHEIAKSIAESYQGRFDNDEAFEEGFISKSISRIPNISHSSGNTISESLDMEKVRHYIYVNYTSHNGYYFSREG